MKFKMVRRDDRVHYGLNAEESTFCGQPLRPLVTKAKDAALCAACLDELSKQTHLVIAE